MTEMRWCGKHGDHFGYECHQCLLDDRHQESMKVAEQGHRDQQRMVEEIEQQRQEADDHAFEMQQLQRDAIAKAEVSARLHSTGKIQVQEDVRMALVCMDQQDLVLAANLLDGSAIREGAVKRWPTYAWGWLASARLAAATGGDPAPSLGRALQNATANEADALMLLPLDGEFADHLESLAKDTVQRQMCHADLARHRFIAALYVLSRGDAHRRVILNGGRYSEVIRNCLLGVEPDHLVSYAAAVREEVIALTSKELFKGSNAFRNREAEATSAKVEMVLRIAGRMNRNEAREAAEAVLLSWCDIIYGKDPSNVAAITSSVVASIKVTVANLPWGAPKELVKLASAQADSRAAAVETSRLNEAERAKTQEVQRKVEAARAEAERDAAERMTSWKVAGGVVIVIALMWGAASAFEPGESGQTAPTAPAVADTTPAAPTANPVIPPEVMAQLAAQLRDRAANLPPAPVVARDWLADAEAQKHRERERYRFECPARGRDGVAIGTTVYSTRSSVCEAAVHAGVIQRASGGTATILIGPVVDGFDNSERNRVDSHFSNHHHQSFTFVQ